MLFFIISFSIVAGLFLIALILYFTFLSIISKKIISQIFDHRYDDDHTLKYFTVDDFKNLIAEPIEFKNDNNLTLKGYIYSSTKTETPKALLILAHGLGAGHLQYTTEINYFAQKGFTVLAYDDTGCNLSEGTGIVCLSYGAVDLASAIKYVKSNDKLNNLPILLYGHSMGAFAVSNVPAILKDESIKGIVALAPFVEETDFIFSNIKNITKSKIEKMLIRNKLKKRMKSNFGLNTIKSISECNIPYFLITGDKDDMVNYEENFAKIMNGLKNKPNFEYLIVNGRYHRPNITLHAAQYYKVTNNEIKVITKENNSEKSKEFYANLDYNLLTQLDDKVMNQIVKFYETCLTKE